MSTSPIEPNALQRQAAFDLFELFVALKQGGFTEAQSLVILANMLAASGNTKSEE